MYHSRFKGSHYDAGFKYGSILNKNGVSLADILISTPEKIDYMHKCVIEYERFFPEVLEEIKGIADGLKIPFEDLATFIFCMYSFVYDNGCTCFAFKDKDNIIFGRNSDFIVSIEKSNESNYYHLDNSYSFIGNTTFMVQMEDGINEHGLAIGLTFTYPTVRKPGFNAGILVRYILEKCKTVGEAVEQLHKLPIGSSQTLTMVDKTGDMAVVECNCEKIAVNRSENGENFVAITNHFMSEEMIQYRYNGVDDIHSFERYQTVYNTLKCNKDYSLEFTKDLLAGKYGFMCQYDRKKGFDTVWSSIYDLKNNKIYRVEGNPSRKKFIEDTRLKLSEKVQC